MALSNDYERFASQLGDANPTTCNSSDAILGIYADKEFSHYNSREHSSMLRGIAGTLPNENGPRAVRGLYALHDYHLENDYDTENNFVPYAKKYQGNAVDRRDFSELKARVAFDPHNSAKLGLDHIEEVAFATGGESEYIRMNDFVKETATRGSRSTGPFIRPMEVGTRGGTIRSHAPGTSTHRINPETDGHNADLFAAQLKLDNRHKIPIIPSVDAWHDQPSGNCDDCDDYDAGGVLSLGKRSRIPAIHNDRNGTLPSVAAGGLHPIFKSRAKADIVYTLSKNNDIMLDVSQRDGILLDAPTRVGAKHLRFSEQDERRPIEGILPHDFGEESAMLGGSNFEMGGPHIRNSKRELHRFTTDVHAGHSPWLSLHMQ